MKEKHYTKVTTNSFNIKGTLQWNFFTQKQSNTGDREIFDFDCYILTKSRLVSK